MMLLINCKAIYGTDIPWMSTVLKQMGHEIVVLGGPDDLYRDEIFRAEDVMRADKIAVSKLDTTEGRRSAMEGAIEQRSTEEVLVISDDPRDRAAANVLNLPTISPFDFGLEYLGEEPA